MADIKVVIQLQDTTEDEINSLGSSAEVSNASIQNVNGTFNRLSTKGNGANLKSWATGSLSLADGYVGGANTKLVSQYGYNGYVFGAVPESKQLAVTIEIIGSNIDSIVIYGDKVANQYPTKAYRDGNTNDIIYSDDAVWAIRFSEPANSHTITFLEWNRANYNACITYVAELKNKLTLDKSWIKSVESLSQSTGQPKDIYYGVVPNSGSIEIIDANGEIYDYINDGIIENSNLPIQISVNGNVCQSHISNDSDYTTDKIFLIQNTDILQSWQTIKAKPKVRIGSAGTLFGYFKNTMKEEFGFDEQYIQNMCSNIIRDNMSAEEIMTLIRIPYQYHKAETLLDFVNDICNLCQFCVMCDTNGMPKFVNGNPNFNQDSVIKITQGIVYGSPTKDVIIKNKINNIKYLQKSFVKNIKDICNRTVYLRDSDKNFTISNLEGGKIINDNGTNYLCFFMECSDSNSEFIWRTNSSEDGVKYPFVGILRGDGFESSTQIVAIPELDATKKEDYDFYERKGNCCELTYYRTLNSKTFAIALSLSGVSDYQSTISQVTINIMQQCISAITEEKLYNDIQQNVYDLQSSTLMSLETTYNYTEDIYTHNNNELLENYGNGVSVANITIGCLDLYDINGNKVKDFSKGEIIQVGDIVRVDKDNNGNSLWSYKNGSSMFWRVTGRNFRKVGVPMIDLELQEVRVVG